MRAVKTLCFRAGLGDLRVQQEEIIKWLASKNIFPKYNCYYYLTYKNIFCEGE
jgi:hypothetical protein